MAASIRSIFAAPEGRATYEEWKKQKEEQRFRESLQKGDKVVTIGGIHGKVEEVKETTVMISVDNNVKIEVEKSALVASPVRAAAQK